MKAALVISLACMVAACGDPVAPAPPIVDDGLAWHAIDAPPGSDGVVLPGVRHARSDTEPDGDHERYDRTVLGLLPDGDLVIHGHTHHLTTGTPSWRTQARRALRDVLTTRCRTWRDDEPAHAMLCTVMVRASREAPWAAARAVIEMTLEPGIRADRIEWAVQRTLEPGAFRQSARVTRRAVDGAVVPALVLSLRGSKRGTTTEVRLGIGGDEWSFGVGDTDYADADFLRRANQVWGAVKAALPPAASPAGRVALYLPEPAPGVTWGHVVQVLDLLVGAGFDVVDLPEQGWSLTITEPSVEALR